MLKYFLYRHVRIDKDEPFYIGIGVECRRSNRVRYYNRAYVKNGRSIHWKRIVAKTSYEIHILYECDSREEIMQKEKEFIVLYGRLDMGKGTLVNYTDGGEGFNNPSDEARKRISNRMMGNKNSKGYVPSDEIRKNTSERFRGNTTWRGRRHRKESIDKISAARIGKPLPDRHRFNLIGTKPNQKSIKCVTTDVEYKSIGACVREMFDGNRSAKNNISKVCNGKKEYYKKIKFIFI